jgi:hypothetical protein
VVEARTLAEAYAYLELSAPPGEEAVDYDRYSTLTRHADRYVLRFDGPYQEEWFTAEVSVPLDGLGSDPDLPLSYGDGPSRLLDAGQWYALEQGYAGMAEVGRTSPVPDDYYAVVDAWQRARAALAEIEKLLPAGAAELPDESFWSQQGHRVRAAAPQAFRRLRLATARERYGRELAELTRSGPRAELTSPPAGPTSAPTGPGRTGDEPALPARTYAEAHAYLDLHPCECGSAQFPRGTMEVLAAGYDGVVVRYVGPCNACGRPRAFTFRLPDRPGVPPASPYEFSYPEDGPSQLLDAAQWLDVADGYAFFCDQVSAQSGAPGAFAERGEREDMEKCLTAAASALDEVLKFLPRGAEQVPASALWSEQSRARYAADRAAFGRQRLTQRQVDRWGRLTEFTRRYG